jgi:hypothetical protein
MRVSRPIALVAATLALVGCYATHERSGDGSVRDMGSLRDAAPRPDGATGDSSSPDGVLPAEPDPDLGGDARPSDYPEAEDWDDPPSIAPWDPCCTLGAPIRVLDEDEGIHYLTRDQPVRIAWGADRWAVLAQRLDGTDGDIDPHAVIISLDADGNRIDTRVLEQPMLGSGELLFAEGRWAVATENLDDDVSHVSGRLFDRDFRPATPVMDLGTTHQSSLALVRLTHLDRWVALRHEDAVLTLSPFRETGTGPPVHPTPLDAHPIHAVGLRSRIAVLVSHPPEASLPDELLVLGGSSPFLVGPRIETGLLHTFSDVVDNWAAVAALRDVVVIVAAGGGETRFQVIDPFEGRPMRSAQPLADGHAPVDVVGSSKLGVAGTCYSASDDDLRQVRFRLIGPDGLPRGSEVTIASPLRGMCAVGTDDLGFLVAWWDGTELWVRRVFVAG